jgi:hypothetical protein
MMAEEIAYSEIDMERARGASPFGKLVCDIPDDYFRRPALRGLFCQICPGLDEKDWANHWYKEVIEPDCLIYPDRLKEGLIE